MKKLLLLAALGLVTIGSPTALAQNVSQQRRLPGQPPGVPVSPRVEGELKRFDLDFPGGTPGHLAEAISKATGKHLNLIIPASYAATQIMPLKVVGVTVPELFNAIQAASTREVPVVNSWVAGPRSQPGNRTASIEYKTMSLQFVPASATITDDTVWSFQSTAPTEEEKALFSELGEAKHVCQYFQLAPYLEDHTVEDITTAIETGWKMLEVTPMPKLSFHQETKLLIAVGAPDAVQQIPAVLQQLPLDNSAAVEKVAKAMAEIEALKEAKEPGWEKKVEEIEARMKRFGQMERAREELRELTRRKLGIPAPSRPK